MGYGALGWLNIKRRFGSSARGHEGRIGEIGYSGRLTITHEKTSARPPEMRAVSLAAARGPSVGLLLLLLVGLAVLGQRVMAAEEAVEPDAVVGQALIERFGVQQQEIASGKVVVSADEVRRVVRDRVDPVLLRGLRQVSGTDFHFVLPAAQGEAQVGMIVLSYGNSRQPVLLMRTVARRGGYFRQTKILTPFSATPVGNRLVIVYTENAGNDDIVAFVRQAPKYFEYPPETQP